MTPVTFGLFDWMDRGTAPWHQLYEERLQLLEAADAAGFFGYHLAEHHATPLAMAPSPALFLTAAAQRTRCIRLGPLVYLLPLYHPLRLIKEVCMLDHLSNGRLELGILRRVSPYELGSFGVDAADTRAIFTEALAVLLAGLTHERLTFEGQYYRYTNVPMELRPLQRPYPPLWYPTQHPESVGYAAMLEGARSIGSPTFENQNGRMMEGEGGASIIDVRARNGKRQSVFRFYVFPYMDRPNLTVLTHALVTRLTFEGKRATGVEISYGGNTHARRKRQDHRPLGCRQSSVAYAADRRVDPAGRSTSDESPKNSSHWIFRYEVVPWLLKPQT